MLQYDLVTKATIGWSSIFPMNMGLGHPIKKRVDIWVV